MEFGWKLNINADDSVLMAETRVDFQPKINKFEMACGTRKLILL